MIIIILIMTEHVWIGCKKRWRLSADYFAPRGVPQSLTSNNQRCTRCCLHWVLCRWVWPEEQLHWMLSAKDKARVSWPKPAVANAQRHFTKPSSDPNHWCTGSCVQKTKRGYLIKWTVSYCTVWQRTCRHIRWPHFNVPTWVVRHCFKAVGGPPTLADTWHNYLSTLLIKHTDLFIENLVGPNTLVSLGWYNNPEREDQFWNACDLWLNRPCKKH